MKSSTIRWLEYGAAVVAGNSFYFLLSPYLPPAARHHAVLDLGTAVDLWFCLFCYGLIELGRFLLDRWR